MKVTKSEDLIYTAAILNIIHGNSSSCETEKGVHAVPGVSPLAHCWERGEEWAESIWLLTEKSCFFFWLSCCLM